MENILRYLILVMNVEIFIKIDFTSIIKIYVMFLIVLYIDSMNYDSFMLTLV